MKLWTALLLLCAAAAAAAAEEEDAALEKENEELKQRLQMLQERIKEEEQYSYVVTRGYIAGAENVYMETMDIFSAKQYCNSNAKCFGFTFLGGEGDQQPEDEVTVTFKGEPEKGTNLDVEPDQAYVSYVKHTAATSILGHVGDAGMQLDGGSAALVGHWIGFNSAGLLFVVALALFVGCRKNIRKASAQQQEAILPR